MIWGLLESKGLVLRVLLNISRTAFVRLCQTATFRLSSCLGQAVRRSPDISLCNMTELKTSKFHKKLLKFDWKALVVCSVCFQSFYRNYCRLTRNWFIYFAKPLFKLSELMKASDFAGKNSNNKPISFKVGCVSPMVISILPYAELRLNDHSEDAPYFIFLKNKSKSE